MAFFISGLILAAAIFFALTKPAPPERSDVASREYAEAVSAEQAAARPVDLLGIKRPDGRPLRVLFMGDSLSDAAGASSRQAGFVDTLKSRMRPGGKVAATTLALPGQTTRTVAAQMPSGKYDVVLVELGTNDVGRTPVEQFRNDYAEMLTGVRKASADGLLMCLGPWMPQADAADYDDIARQLCKEQDGIYVPLSWAYVKEQYRDDSYDQFHPDDDGHKFIADEVLRWAIPDAYKGTAPSAS